MKTKLDIKIKWKDTFVFCQQKKKKRGEKQKVYRSHAANMHSAIMKILIHLSQKIKWKDTFVFCQQKKKKRGEKQKVYRSHAANMHSAIMKILIHLSQRLCRRWCFDVRGACICRLKGAGSSHSLACALYMSIIYHLFFLLKD